MEPRLVDLDSILLVGLPYYGDPSNGNFGKAWMRMMQVTIPAHQRVNEKVAFGLEVYGPDFHTDHLWYYFPSVQVRNLNEIPVTLFAKTLPAAKYAVFHVTGNLSKIGEMFQYAYMQWLPSSDYEVAYPFDFEWYGEDFKGDVPESEVDLYIPIRLKTG